MHHIATSIHTCVHVWSAAEACVQLDVAKHCGDVHVLSPVAC